MVIGNDFDMQCCTDVHDFFGINNLNSLGNGITAKSSKYTVGGYIRLFFADIEIRKTVPGERHDFLRTTSRAEGRISENR
ncbi:hypothetical protein TNIN_76841 [Trichonephila inaurata madagascariensis]|uniref:Uncharacterized protein n=1 Tax=Trichonephila inaurata madagascariensis TaxID=2747483 RepID=A0A8X6XB40_9ARAC|nr:hypothetical protein TNIN_76841 [Trichonephila inaurata madagascariensis]